jgi:hypothetical protein
MITILAEVAGIPVISTGVEQCLVKYVQSYGQITSLDRWAHEWGINPCWVRTCAHAAARKGLVRLDRLPNVSGRPYRVSALEEKI